MAGVSRQVSARLNVSGTDLPVVSVTVEQTKKASEGGSVKATLSLAAMEQAGLGLDWLATAPSPPCQAIFTVDGEDTVMFTGTLDLGSARLDSSGERVTLSGRDASASMKDTKTNEKFVNQRSEDIASQVAARHGLTIKTDGGTVTAGKIYTEEQAKVTGNQSEWTLIRQLAELEGKVPAVGPNNTLTFNSADDSSLPQYPIFYVRGQSRVPYSDVVSITLTRNFQAGQPTTVTTSSWDHKQQKLITSTKSSGQGGIGSDTAAAASAAASAPPPTTPSVQAGTASETVASAQASQEYAYNHHHMTQEQADKHAASKLKEHTRHEFTISVSMPGDTSLTPFFVIVLTGTGSAFDQSYNIDTLSHSVDSGSGTYRMSIVAKTARSGQ